MAAGPLPTLSEVRAFTGDYLIDAARHWSNSAYQWTDAYDGVARGAVRPAGTEWGGEAAEAAALRVGMDRRRVNGAADELTAVASTAHRAVDDLRAAKAKLLRTVRAAEAAGFEIGDDFSLHTIESTTSEGELAAREAQIRNFGIAIRSDVLGLVKADEDAAAEISEAATRLRSLDFGGTDRDASGHGVIQAIDFHGVPLQEKPAYPPPIPPPEGWSTDPLRRAAQKIAYGHAWNQHRADFPGIRNQAQFAEFIYQKMQRAITDPSGLRLGLTEDRAPAIYDPEDNVLIIRDIRPNATQGGSAYKPQSEKPNYVAGKAPIRVPIFTPEDLADGAHPPSSFPSLHGDGHVNVPPHISEGGVSEAPSRGALPNWGTHISPDEASETDGVLGILGRIILGQTTPDPRDPDCWS